MNIKELKSGDVRKMYPRRDVHSHKGMNGRVLIVGGSLDFYGAPVLAGLGALYSGADLVHIMVPECNFDVTRSLYPDFIVHKFPGNYLDIKAITPIKEVLKKIDVVLIGPGLGKRDETNEVVAKLVNEIELPTVLDANAIQVFQKITEVPSQQIVITPHHNEFETLTGKDIKIKGSISNKMVLMRTLATDLKITIVLKGPEDLIASEDGQVVANRTGHPGMTVGGSGDVLSGCIASLMGQGAGPFVASQIAAHSVGKAGELLAKQKGNNFSASDLAFELPFALREFS